MQDWKDISPRLGVAMNIFGDGRTAIKASVAKYITGQQIAVANAANPVTVLGLIDTRPWTNLDGNGLPLDANGNIQFNELSPVGLPRHRPSEGMCPRRRRIRAS